MRSGARKTAPGVRNGHVKKKNRHELTPSYWNTFQATPVIDRERPGKGYRHLLRKEDIERFVTILPSWDTCSQGLDAIVLAKGDESRDGWYDRGVIGISAWNRTLPRVWSKRHFREHAAVLQSIGVPWKDLSSGFRIDFTEMTARAFQLVHVFTHELGHHIDRMTTRRKIDGTRGEDYSEQWALRFQAVIWERYCELFDHV
jgi:hypothetical protein